MKIHIEITMYGESYSGYNVWGVIERVQSMESHIKSSEIHIEGIIFGDS